MTNHIVSLDGPNDKFLPYAISDDPLLFVPLRDSDHEDALQINVEAVLSKHGLQPASAARDFLDAAIAAYTADVRVSRRAAYDGWTRDLLLYMSVREVDLWSRAAPIYQRMLRFLTGDYWNLEVRPALPGEEKSSDEVSPDDARLDASVACLFSGGLDSFIGGVNEAERSGRVVLVGHHSRGGGATSKSQKQALDALRTRYSEEVAPFLQFWVSPPKGKHRASEITTRGRSILFLALGVAVASGLAQARRESNGHERARLVIPENGFISLNVPLTGARMGSFSTRTTHPHLMRLLRELLQALELPIDVDLPFRFQTKGEMLRDCAAPDMVASGIAATMSCSHPGAGRFGAGRNPNQHCGYCVPCIIRRAAIASVSPDPTSYGASSLKQPLSQIRGADLRSLSIALAKWQERPPRLTDLLLPGPLPGDDRELHAYFSMFKRNLDEIRNFLQ